MASLLPTSISAPKLIVQIAIVGAQIFGKAFVAAGRQAVLNAKHRQGGPSEEVAGVNHAGSGSSTDVLTREHRMTLDEAHLVLNVKKTDAMEDILKNYEHLFKANSVREPVAPTKSTSKAAAQAYQSHYLQSKVVRARERIEAELQASHDVETKIPAENAEAPPPSSTTSSPPPSSSSTP